MKPLVKILLALFVFSSCGGSTTNTKTTGPLVFTYKNYKKEWHTTKKGKKLLATIEISYPVFTAGPDMDALDVINKAVRKLVLVPFINAKLKMDNEEAVMDDFIKSYKSSLKDSNYPTSWGTQTKIKVSYHKKGLVAISMYAGGYTGGAHGNHSTTFYNFNTDTGALLTMKDVFVEGAMDTLNKKGAQILRKKFKVAADKSLNSKGFYLKGGKFSLNTNFQIVKKGIKFLFNPYEIAPYVMGSIEILFPRSEIKHLLRSGF